jgi:glutamine synthetase
VMLSAGLRGIEGEYALPAPTEENVFLLSEAQRAEREIATLPGSLGEAIDAYSCSDLMRQTLGDHTFESLLQNKQIEWGEYRAHVTDFEMQRYLPVL